MALSAGLLVLDVATAPHNTADHGPKRWSACAGCGHSIPPTALSRMHRRAMRVHAAVHPHCAMVFSCQAARVHPHTRSLTG
jgi:pyruvate/2-oxoacid:ferredoxin oxidoreductase beta subunit